MSKRLKANGLGARVKADTGDRTRRQNRRPTSETEPEGRNPKAKTES